MILSLSEQVPLKQYSTFGIGGPARYLVEVSSIEELQEATGFARSMALPLLVLGKGSNCLFSDEGFSGLVIINRISFIEHNGNGLFTVGAGYSFAHLGRLTAKEGWSGLEFAAGIPASVGGAVFMNAGANKQETKDTLCFVNALLPDSTVYTYSAKELSFGYRFSSFQQNQASIISCVFQLAASSLSATAMQEKITYRLKTQPYSEKSIGCIFKNPPGDSAGRLIEAAGLKGRRVGGAQVSPVHANFIVNTGNAKANDVIQLIHVVVEHVQKNCGVTLMPEVRLIQ